jgi:hypothetical protein
MTRKKARYVVLPSAKLVAEFVPRGTEETFQETEDGPETTEVLVHDAWRFRYGDSAYDIPEQFYDWLLECAKREREYDDT